MTASAGLRTLLLAGLVAGAPARAQSPPADAASLDALSRRLHRVADSLVRTSRVPGLTIAAAFGDGRVVTAAAGVNDEVQGTSMTNFSVMHAGPAGRTLLAALALAKVAEGSLSLDARVIGLLREPDWLRELPNWDELTVRMLLAHTSGIPALPSVLTDSAAAAPGVAHGGLDAVRPLRGAQPAGAAGAAHLYSAANDYLLGALLDGGQSGFAYTEIERRFLTPLRLVHTRPAVTVRAPGLATGHPAPDDSLLRGRAAEPGRLALDPAFELGAGGFYSTARDLARWLAALGSGRVVPERVWSRALDGVPVPGGSPTRRFGLGVQIDTTSAGPAAGREGTYPGYATWVRWYPLHRVAVAIQANTSDPRRFTQDLGRVLDAVASWF